MDIPSFVLPDWFSDTENTFNYQTRSLYSRQIEGYTLEDLMELRFHDRVIAITRVMLPAGRYPPHFHKESEAVFIVETGNALLTPHSLPLITGDKVHVPKNTLHGFDASTQFTFISFQTPPIRNKDTGAEDFYL